MLNTNANGMKNKTNELDLFVSEELINQFINKCKEDRFFINRKNEPKYL